MWWSGGLAVLDMGRCSCGGSGGSVLMGIGAMAASENCTWTQARLLLRWSDCVDDTHTHNVLSFSVGEWLRDVV